MKAAPERKPAVQKEVEREEEVDCSDEEVQFDQIGMTAITFFFLLLLSDHHCIVFYAVVQKPQAWRVVLDCAGLFTGDATTCGLVRRGKKKFSGLWWHTVKVIWGSGGRAWLLIDRFRKTGRGCNAESGTEIPFCIWKKQRAVYRTTSWTSDRRQPTLLCKRLEYFWFVIVGLQLQASIRDNGFSGKCD